jgi:hypothetical protein
MTIGTSGWVNPSGISGLGLNVISTELNVISGKPKSYNYYYKLSRMNTTIIKPIKLSNYKNFTRNTFLTTNTNFFIGGNTGSISWSATDWLSGDSIANNTLVNSFNARTSFGATRSICMYMNNIVYANPSDSITVSGRFGQSGSITNYSFQVWYNIGAGYVLITSIVATGGNGASAATTFNLPAAINSTGIYSIATTLSNTALSSLNSTTIANAATYKLSVDIYLLEII